MKEIDSSDGTVVTFLPETHKDYEFLLNTPVKAFVVRGIALDSLNDTLIRVATEQAAKLKKMMLERSLTVSKSC